MARSTGPIPQQGEAPDIQRESYGSKTEKVVLEAIREDPFYTISELRVVIEEALPGSKAGWWGVFKILRRLKLLSRRSRFRYARQHRRPL